MRLGNLIWNILNFILFLGVIIVLAWPLIGPSPSKSIFKPNRESFIEYFYEKNDNNKDITSYKKAYRVEHPLGTDSYGRDKLNTIANATLRNIRYALVAVVPFLILGISAGLVLAFSRGRTIISLKRKYFSFGGIIYHFVDWIVKILHSFPVVIVIAVGVLFTEIILPEDWRIYGLMLFFGVVSVPLLAYDIEKEVNVLRKQEFIKASEALGISKFRLIFVDVLWFSSRSVIFSRCMSVFLAAIAIEIFKTYYMSSSSDTSLGTLFNQNYWFDYKNQVVFFLCMVFFSLRWFTEKLIYDDGVSYG